MSSRIEAGREASPPPGAPMATFNVLGVRVTASTMDGVVDFLLDSAEHGRRGYVCVAGVHGIVECRRDASLRRVFNRALVCTCDGMPLVWEGRRAVGSWVERVYGPDLLLRTMDATRDGRFSHFFYGGNEGVAAELAARLRERFPGVRIVGAECPPFRPLNETEAEALASRIEALRPDFFWVGLSTPKQDRFMAEYSSRLAATVMLGVGAAFDFHTGRASEAPRWMMNAGLQWLHRLASDPRRLWKRYATIVPRYLAWIALQRSGLRAFPIED